MRSLFLSLCVLATPLLCMLPDSGRATRIVLAGDDWTFRNDGGFATLNADTVQLSLNLAQFLTGGSGAIHAYVNGLDPAYGSMLESTLENAGYTFTKGTAIGFDLVTLLGFDAIFLGSQFLTAQQIDVLVSYAKAGGGVYVHGGLLGTMPENVPAAWNPFLTTFNLSLGGAPLNGLSGAINIIDSNSHPLFDELFTGVSQVRVEAGHRITGCCVVASDDSATPVALFAAVPEPTTLLLLATGIAALAWRVRRKLSA